MSSGNSCKNSDESFGNENNNNFGSFGDDEVMQPTNLRTFGRSASFKDDGGYADSEEVGNAFR